MFKNRVLSNLIGHFSFFLILTSCPFLLLNNAACNRTSTIDNDTTSRNAGENPEQLSAVQKGIQYLVSQQGEDNIWHSPNYGNLKDGAAISALVIYSLSHQPAELLKSKRANIERAIERLIDNSKDAEYIKNVDGPDYSNYATALFLISCKQFEHNLQQTQSNRLLRYLVDAQLTFESAGVDHGGWDYSGWMTGERPTPGTNVSVTCLVVECLRLYSNQIDSNDALKNTIAWAKRTQNEDGGFCFHPKRSHDGNKAGWNDEPRTKPNSYGSSTADGLRILLACGMAKDDKRFISVLDWIKNNLDAEKVPGFENLEHTGGWDQGLLYYWFYSVSKCLELLPEEQSKQFAEALQKKIIDLQNDDGSWANPNARMREDDPLIATSFALIALSACEKVLQDD